MTSTLKIGDSPISAIGYGLMNLTWRPQQTPDAQAFEAMKLAIDSGNTFFNSGEFYGQPDPTLNLQLLARFFEAEPTYKDKIFLSVKGAIAPNHSPDSSPEGLRRSVENINRLLKHRKMDLFEPARVDSTRPVEEVIKSLAALRDEGHFKHIGISEVSAKTIRQAHAVAPIAAVEAEYSPWSLDIETNGVLETCKELKIPIVVYSPLGRGFLTGSIKSFDDLPEGDGRRHFDRFQPENFNKNLDIVAKIKAIADKNDLSPAQLILFLDQSSMGWFHLDPGSLQGPAERLMSESDAVREVSSHFGPVVSAPTEAELEKGAGDKHFPEEEVFEEGGWRGWLNVLGAFLLLMSTFGYVSAYGVYQSYYETHQLSSMSASPIAWIGSVGISLEYCTGALGGQLFDKGWYYWPMRMGCVVFVVCLFMISLCEKYWQFFLAQGVGIGFSIGLVCLPSLCVIPQYFQKRRAMAMGIGMSGTSLGAAVFPVILNSMFEKKGFKQGVRIAGYFALGCMLAANFMMKTKYKKVVEGVAKHKRPSLKQLALEPRYVMSVSAGFLLTMAMFFPIYYIQTWFGNLGISNNITLYSLSILNAGSFFGRIAPNAMVDHFGPLNVLTINAVVGGCLTFGMFGVRNTAGAIVFTLIYGFVSGGFVSILSPVFLQLSRDPSEDGIRQGCGFFVCGIAALIGPPITGALISADNGGFTYGIIFSACIMFAGAAASGYTRFLLARERGTWKV